MYGSGLCPISLQDNMFPVQKKKKQLMQQEQAKAQKSLLVTQTLLEQHASGSL